MKEDLKNPQENPTTKDKTKSKDINADKVIDLVDRANEIFDGKQQKVIAKVTSVAATASMAYQMGSSIKNKNKSKSGSKPSGESGSSSNSQMGGTPDASPNSQINNNQPTISNAEAISRHFVFGVSHLVNLKIMVEGTELKYYKSFQLSQTAIGHHYFNLVLSHDSLGNEETYQMEQAQNLLGKRLLLTFSYKNILDKPERDFIGVVTGVSFQQEHGSKGYIVLTGHSPTILLDEAPHIQSFGGSNSIPLNTIVSQVLEEGYKQGNKYKFEIKSSKNLNLSYSCQYNETHYNYLARTAEAYGEQFFYDGETLYFGDLPSGEEPIKLVYGRDVENVQVKMQTCHVNRQYFGYNSSSNERLSPGGDTKLKHAASIAKSAYDISESTFTSPSLQVAPINASTNKDIEMAQRSVSGSVGVNVFITSGVTSVPFLYPGCIVELNMLKPGTTQSNYFTKLMITEINHSVDGLGHYKGQFKAIASDTGFLPKPSFNMPIVESQIAKVVNNEDPDNQGRVQVQFDWQNDDLNTEFIRVMTPDAGCSEKVGKNRGFMAIPEVGDQVMVGFVQQHPDRPFVMGSMFHGQIAGGGGQDNNIKSISTKSGHIIIYDDATGIQIIDKDENSVVLSGDGSITTKSKKKIALECGKSSITLTKDGKIEITGVNIITNGDSISNNAKTTLLDQSGEASMQLSSKGDTASLSSKETSISGKKKTMVSGGESTSISAMGTTSIEGAIVKLN